jgi:hypothetical protein
VDAGAGSGLSDRDKWLWLGGTLGLLVALVVVVLVFAGGSGDEPDLASADGVLTEVTADHVEMFASPPVEGRRRLRFLVEDADRASLDIPHLKLHVRDALPTRVFYEQDGDEYYIRRTEDLPSPRP